MRKKATNFGSKLKTYLDAGTVQANTVAEMAKISLPTLYRIRDGKADPQESTMIKISSALGYTLSQFIEDKPSSVHTLDDCYEAIGRAIKK